MQAHLAGRIYAKREPALYAELWVASLKGGAFTIQTGIDGFLQHGSVKTASYEPITYLVGTADATGEAAAIIAKHRWWQ
jgi:hypothetical protein